MSTLAGPAGLEPATPGLEEQWRISEAALVPAICGATHATYRRARIADCSQEAQHLATGCLFSWWFFSHELGFSSLVGAGKAVFLELVLMLRPLTTWSVLLVVLFT